MHWTGLRARPALGDTLAIICVLAAAVLPASGAGFVPAGTSAPAPRPVFTTSVEPVDGYASVDRLISRARRAVDLSMYELADPRVESLLAAARRRGVHERVLVDRAYHGESVNRAAVAALREAGVPVRWASGSAIDHEKCLVVDHSVAAVMTGNLVARDYPTTRDVVVVLDRAAMVAAIESTFDRDWRGGPVTAGSPSPGLIWSPAATSSLAALIGSARRSLSIETEEIGSAPIDSALAAAARRGVVVQLVMTSDRRQRRPLAALAAAGVHEVLYRAEPGVLDIHAKAIVVDDRTAFVGSENLSRASLTADRELGIVTTDPAVVVPVSRMLRADLVAGGRDPPPVRAG